MASQSAVLHASLAATPPHITSASGLYLTTTTGQKILDASGGAAVASLGHAHPAVLAALRSQLDTGLTYTFSPWFTTTPYESLARFIVDSTGGRLSRVFVTGSGAEAVEAAIKLARQYFVEKGEGHARTRFVSRDRSYHGNTLGSLSVSGHKARRKIYEPLLLEEGLKVGFVSPCYVYRDLKEGESVIDYVERLRIELDREMSRGDGEVCAVIMETMAGLTLGAVPPVKGYLRMVREVCDKHGALLILDEVLAGMGRTGTLHAWEQEGVVPDLQTVAKGLGAGYEPIGALLVSQKVVDVLDQGSKAFMHFQTYHGHPLTCTAALAVQNAIQDENLLDNVNRMGSYLSQLLKERLGSHKHVGDIRGRGLIWAIELVKDKETKEPFQVGEKIAPTIHATGLQPEFSISLMPGGGVANGVDGDLIVIAPPFTVTKQDVEDVVERAAGAIERVLGPVVAARL